MDTDDPMDGKEDGVVNVRFQLIDQRHPCLEQVSLSLKLDTSLSTVRTAIENNVTREFVFLFRCRAIKPSRENGIKLNSILPKLPSGIPGEQFRFKNTQYQTVCKTNTDTITYIGLVYLCHNEGYDQWYKTDLRHSLYEQPLYGFSFIPTSILSTDSILIGHHVERLNEHAATGDLYELQDTFESITVNVPDYNFSDHRKATPLHYAASNGHINVCEYLVGKLGRVALSKPDINFRTPLHCALLRGKIEIVVYLMQLSPDLESRDILGLSCRDLILKLKPPKSEQLLSCLEYSLLDDKLILYLTCLAIQMRLLQVGRKLCKIVKIFPESRTLPLHLAAELGDRDMVESLVKREDDSAHSPLESDKDGHLPIHYACQHGHTSIISLLYYDILTEKDFQKSVRLAIDCKKYDVLLTLSKLRTDFELDVKYHEVLIRAAENDLTLNGKCVVPVLKSSSHVMQRLTSEAARQNNLEILNLLSSLNTKLDYQDTMGRSPLHEAANTNNLEAAKFLLEHGVQQHLRDWQGSTALHYACRSGDVDMVSLLLTHSTDSVNLKDNCHRNTFMVAVVSGNTDIVIYLLRHSVPDVCALDIHDMSFFNYLVELNPEVVPLILDLLTPIYSRASTESNTVITENTTGKLFPKTVQYECKTCKRKWRTFKWHTRFTHMCFNSDNKRYLHKASKSNLDILLVPKTSPKCSYRELFISAIQTHITKNRTEYLKQLLDFTQNDLTEKDLSNLCYCAAKFWNIDAVNIIGNFWEISQTLYSQMLHIVVLMESLCDQSKAKKLKTVQYLIKCGATPNSFIYGCPFDIKCEVIRWTPSSNNRIKSLSSQEPNSEENEKSYLPLILEGLLLTKQEMTNSVYVPLELAVIQNDYRLVDVLISNGASPRICFALHLAICLNYSKIVNLIMKYWNSEEEVVISGHFNVENLYRICSDSRGIFQAVCASKLPLELIEYLYNCFPGMIKSASVLTSLEVARVRPEAIKNTLPDFKCFIYTCSDDGDCILPNLPLSKLLLNSVTTYTNDIANESALNVIMNQGPNLLNMRISEKCEVHAACELFATSVKEKRWYECGQFLKEGSGEVIWQCLLTSHSLCHKHIYQSDSQTSPLISTVIQNLMTNAPAFCLHLFFSCAKCVLSGLDTASLQSVFVNMKTILSKSNLTINESYGILELMVLSNLVILMKTPKGLYICAKMLLILPDIFSVILNISRSIRKVNYLQLALKHIDFDPPVPCKRPISDLIDRVHTNCTEVRLLRIIQQFKQKEMHDIINKDISLARIACVLGELDIVKCTHSSVSSISSSEKFYTCLLDTAAAFHQYHIMEYLLKNYGVKVRPITISAACYGPVAIGMTFWQPTLTKRTRTREDAVTHTVKWILDRQPVNILDISACYIALLKASIQLPCWDLTRWCFKNANFIKMDFTNMSELLMLALWNSPVDICQYIIKREDFNWTVFTQEDVALTFRMVTLRNDDATHELLTSILNSYTFEGLEHLSNKDNRSALHVLCAQGHMDVVKIILNQLLRTCDSSQIDKVINASDSSKATPLWYALAYKHWGLARMLLLNGAVLQNQRSVPGLTSKRIFVVAKQIFKSDRYGKGGRGIFQVKRNTSINVLKFVGSDEAFFEKLYNDDATNSTKQIDKHFMVPVEIPYDTTGHQVQYLVRLMLQAKQQNATSLLNLAITIGEVDLVQDILRQPLRKIYHKTGSISPLSVAIINDSKELVGLCKQFEMDSYLISCVVTRAIGNTSIHHYSELVKNAARLLILNKSISQSFHKHLDNLNLLLERARKLKQFSSSSISDKLNMEDFLPHVRRSSTARVQILTTEYVLFASLFGEMWLFVLLRSLCKTESEYLQYITKPLVDTFSAVDLLFIFSEKDKYSRGASVDVDNRVKCIIQMCSETNHQIHLSDVAFTAILNNRLYKMMTPLAARIKIPKDILTPMLEEATHLGYSDFVIEMCNNQNTTSISDWSPMINRLTCLSAISGNHTLFSYFLNKWTGIVNDFIIPIQDVCTFARPSSKSILECTIISNRIEVVKTIVHKLTSYNKPLDTSSLKSALELAYSKGNKETIHVLQRFVMCHSTSIIDDDFKSKMLLLAARRGSEDICLSLINSSDIIVSTTDAIGFNSLQYACIYGQHKLIGKLVSLDPNGIFTQNRHGFGALDYLKAFGHISLFLTLIDNHNASLSHNDEFSSSFGWLRHSLNQNENTLTNKIVSNIYIKRMRQPLTLSNIIKLGDDQGASWHLKAMQEAIVLKMKKNYTVSPIIHLCARYNCQLTLKVMLDLIKTYSTDNLAYWLTVELNGRIPIVEAIECGNNNIVNMLMQTGLYDNWRYRTGENILHFVTRYGSHDVAECVTRMGNGDTSLYNIEDNCGLVPATTAVASGNQHILHFVTKQDFYSNLHPDHNITVYNCTECLLDYCIGWFKHLQLQRTTNKTICNREITNRKESHSGFRTKTNRKKVSYAHPLEKLLMWRSVSKSDEAINSALNAMGYSFQSGIAELFLLFSKYGDIENVLDVALKQKSSRPILYLLQHGYKPSSERSVQILTHSVANHLNDLVLYFYSNDNMTAFRNHKPSTSATLLDIAYGMGNSEIVNLYEKNSDHYQRWQELSIIPEIMECLPIKIRCRIKPDCVPISKKRNRRERLSDFDTCLLLPIHNQIEIYNTININSNGILIFPRKVFGKQVRVNSNSIKACAADLKVSTSQVVSILFSKLVIGQYYHKVDRLRESWRKLKSINVSIAATASNVITENILYDSVRIVANIESGQMIVDTAELPSDILPVPVDYKQCINEYIQDIQSTMELILPVSIQMDWSSFDKIQDSESSESIIRHLASPSSFNPLNKLKDTIIKCKQLLDDMSKIFNKASKELVINILKNVSNIQIVFCQHYQDKKNQIEFNLDKTQYWRFSISEDGTSCPYTQLPLLSVVEMCHSVYLDLAAAIHKMSNKKKPESKRSPKGSPVVLSIDWYSMFRVKSVDEIKIMFHDCLRHQVFELADVYLTMPYLSLDVKRLIVSLARSPDLVGIAHQDGVISMSLFAEYIDGIWISTELDSECYLLKLQTEQLMFSWENNSPKATQTFNKSVLNLQTLLGREVKLDINPECLMNTICNSSYTDMTHPYKQYKFEASYFKKLVECTYQDKVMENLDYSNYFWKLGKALMTSGLWCWVTEAELNGMESDDIFMSLIYGKGDKSLFKMRSKEQILKISKNKNIVCWMAFDEITNRLSVNGHDRIQILTFMGGVYYIADTDKALTLLCCLPNTFNFGRQDNTHDTQVVFLKRYTSLTIPLFFDRALFQKNTEADYYKFLSWETALMVGYNVIISADTGHHVFGHSTLITIADIIEDVVNFYTLMTNSLKFKKNQIIFVQVIENGPETAFVETTSSGDLIVKIPYESNKEDLFSSNVVFSKINYLNLSDELNDDLIPEEYDDCDVPITYTTTSNKHSSQEVKVRSLPKIKRIVLRRLKLVGKLTIKRANKQLIEAAKQMKTETIHRLLDVAADINTQDQDGNTALIVAAIRGNYTVEKLLLERGADIHVQNKIKRSALHYETMNGNIRSMVMLISSGAKIDVDDKSRCTPLVLAVKNNQYEAANLLVFCGAVLNKPNKNGEPNPASKKNKWARLILMSDSVVKGITKRFIHVEFGKVVDDLHKIQTLSLSIAKPRSLHGRSVHFIGRRWSVDYGHHPLLETSSETPISDVFEFKWSANASKQQVLVHIPVKSEANDLYVKTPTRIYKVYSPKFHSTENQVFCSFKMVFADTKSFVLVQKDREGISTNHNSIVPAIVKIPNGDGGNGSFLPLVKTILAFANKEENIENWATFLQPVIVQKTEPLMIGVENESVEPTFLKEFVSGDLVQQLSRIVGGDCRTLALSLGYTSASVDKYIERYGSGTSSTSELLENWRKTRKHYSDGGLQELLVALDTTRIPGLMNGVLNSLRSWLESRKDLTESFQCFISIYMDIVD